MTLYIWRTGSPAPFLGLTSDSTSRMVSPADGSSFQPTTCTAVLGAASARACPFSSNRKRTLAQHFPATRTQPRLSVPLWTMAVVSGLRRQRVKAGPAERLVPVLEDSPFAFVRSALDDDCLHRTARVSLQLQNLRQRHRGLGQG